MRTRPMLSAWLVAVAVAGCASSDMSAARVRVVNDANLVRSCQQLGTVADDEIGDLYAPQPGDTSSPRSGSGPPAAPPCPPRYACASRPSQM